MNKYPETRNCDKVYPLRYSEEKGWYRVPYFVMPSPLGWLKKHSERKYYLQEVDVGIYVLGSIHGDKVPNAKKIKVECPDHQFTLLEPVDSTTLFCGECAPHKFVRNGEILKKIVHLRQYGNISYEIPEE